MRIHLYFMVLAALLVVAPIRLQAESCNTLEQSMSTDTGFQHPENLAPESRQRLDNPPSGEVEASSLDGRYKAVALRVPGEESHVILMHDIAYERHGGASAIRILAHTAPVLSIAFSPDSRRMATGAADGVIRLWALNKGGTARLLTETQTHGQGITSLSFNPKGDFLLSRTADSQSALWDVHKGKFVARQIPVLSER